MDASRTHEATHRHSPWSWMLIGAAGLIVAAAIILVLLWMTNDAPEFNGSTTGGRQSGTEVGTVPDRGGSGISAEDAQKRASHQQM